MDTVFQRCRHLVGSFNHNAELKRSLRDQQDTLDYEMKNTLQSEAPTRFSYLYTMINSIVINKEALEIMQQHKDNAKIREYLPTAEEYI